MKWAQCCLGPIRKNDSAAEEPLTRLKPNEFAYSDSDFATRGLAASPFITPTLSIRLLLFALLCDLTSVLVIRHIAPPVYFALSLIHI